MYKRGIASNFILLGIGIAAIVGIFAINAIIGTNAPEGPVASAPEVETPDAVLDDTSVPSNDDIGAPSQTTPQVPATPLPPPPQTSVASGWKKFENKHDLKVSFMYPPEWELLESRTVTYAANREHMYGTADDDPAGWEESRENCQDAAQEKYGRSECFSHLFYLDLNDGAPKGVLAVTGKFYISAPKGGNSFGLTAVDLFTQPCTSANQCATFTNSNSVIIQRRYGKWNTGENPDYFVYAILPAPADKQTLGYIFSMERFNSFPNAQSIFDSMLDSVAYIN